MEEHITALIDKIFTEYGLTVVLLLLMLWRESRKNDVMTKTLFNIVENNTLAMEKLTNLILRGKQ